MTWLCSSSSFGLSSALTAVCTPGGAMLFVAFKIPASIADIDSKQDEFWLAISQAITGSVYRKFFSSNWEQKCPYLREQYLQIFSQKRINRRPGSQAFGVQTPDSINCCSFAATGQESTCSKYRQKSCLSWQFLLIFVGSHSEWNESLHTPKRGYNLSHGTAQPEYPCFVAHVIESSLHLSFPLWDHHLNLRVCFRKNVFFASRPPWAWLPACLHALQIHVSVV